MTTNGNTPVPRWRRVVLKLSGEALASAASDETIDAAKAQVLRVLL